MHVASLQNRIGAMNSLYQDAVKDMTLEQVNHQEREGVSSSQGASATTGQMAKTEAVTAITKVAASAASMSFMAGMVHWRQAK